jgi:hypothetical protein
MPRLHACDLPGLTFAFDQCYVWCALDAAYVKALERRCPKRGHGRADEGDPTDRDGGRAAVWRQLEDGGSQLVIGADAADGCRLHWPAAGVAPVQYQRCIAIHKAGIDFVDDVIKLSYAWAEVKDRF